MQDGRPILRYWNWGGFGDWARWARHIMALKSRPLSTELDANGRPTLQYWNQGDRRLGLMEGGCRLLWYLNQGGWWLAMICIMGTPPIRVLKSRQSSTGLDERWVPPMAVLKSRRSSTGHDARWVPPITGLISRWLATGHGGALGFWNQGSRPLGLMQDGRRPLRDWNQGGWWLGMMSTLHYDIEIKVGRQLGLMQDWAPHIT